MSEFLGVLLKVRWFFQSFIIFILFYGVALQGAAFEFSWGIDETPEGAESATVVEPVQFVLLDEASSSAIP